MRKWIAEKIVLRGKRKQYMEELRFLEWASKEEIAAYQKARLEEVLSDARKNVPYYRQHAKGDRLQDFPILTRTQIQANQDQLRVESRMDGRTHREKTSGTTSEPMIFLMDGDCRERGAVIKLFFFEWAGVKAGQPIAKFWGYFSFPSWQARVKSGLSEWVRNIHRMNVLDMHEDIMDGYVDEIKKLQPKLILGYAQSFYAFAKYLDKKGIKVDFPGSVMTSVSVLTQGMRETIESVFQCKVFNRYGSRELMDMACDCHFHQGLHVNPWLHHVDILDEQGNPCPPGVMGRIVVTQLYNPVMPFIRYDTQDYGAWTKKACECGRNWPTIEQIDGRRINLFRFRQGGFMSSYYVIYHITHTIGDEKIKNQQVIQEDFNRYRIKLVLYQPEQWADMQTERDTIQQIVSERIGEPAIMEYEICQSIPRSPSGKFFQSICNLPEEDQ